MEEENLRFPTDSRARERPVKAARAERIELRQSYKRVGKILLKQQRRCPALERVPLDEFQYNEVWSV